MAKIKILVVDDEPAIRFGIREFLAAHGYEIDEAESCQAAEEAFRAARPDMAICDYMLPDGNALDLLPRLKAIDAEVPVVILTGHGSIDLAVRAIKEGAEQFLTKPVELPALLVVVQRLVEHRRNRHGRTGTAQAAEGVGGAALPPPRQRQRSPSRCAHHQRHASGPRARRRRAALP